MTSPRYRQTPDSNQSEIVAALHKVGAMVYDMHRIGGGLPDLLVGYRKCLFLLEVKTSHGKLTPKQKEFHAMWSGYLYTVRTVEDALRVIGAWNG